MEWTAAATGAVCSLFVAVRLSCCAAVLFLFVRLTADGLKVASPPRWLSQRLSLGVTRSYRVAKSGTVGTSGINTVTQFGFGCSWSAVRTSLSFLLLQEILFELSAKRIRLWWAWHVFFFFHELTAGWKAYMEKERWLPALTGSQRFAAEVCLFISFISWFICLRLFIYPESS